MMLAIWHGNLWRCGDTDTPGHPNTVELTTMDGRVTKHAPLNSAGLVIDPTDDEAADYCGTCGSPTEDCGGCQHGNPTLMGHSERMEWLVVDWPDGGRTWHVDDEDGDVLAQLLDQLPDEARLYRVSGSCTIDTVTEVFSDDRDHLEGAAL